MKKILLTLFILISSYCHSQVAHVFSIESEVYSITFSKSDNNYEFNLTKVGESDPDSFTLPKLDVGVFTTILRNKLPKKDSDELYKKMVDKKIEEIFYTVVANIDAIDDLNYAPIAGTLKVNKEINLYRDIKHKKSSKIDGIRFQVVNAQIVFQQGFIQDIIVDGIIIEDSSTTPDSIKLEEFKDAQLRFSNYYGIGFSTKKNVRNLNRINLYPNQKKEVSKLFLFNKPEKAEKGNADNKKLKGKQEKTDKWANLFELNEMHIKLSEVIEFYDFKNGLYTTDFSPANIKVTLDSDRSTTLYKDKTYKILEARVFSDFLGFQSEEPNGLLQFEVEKQFNFNTTRYKFLTYRIRTGIGVMEYLKLSGGVTKIEDNNRALVPEMADVPATSFTGDPILLNKRYTTPIDVVNHQTWKVGVNTNAILLDIPLIKSQMHINGGFRFAQTKVLDSIRTLNADLTIKSKAKEYNLSYWLFYPEVTWHILPETRYGFYASYRPKYFYSISDGIEFAGPQNQLTGTRRENISSWINEYELLGYLYVNEEKQNGKLFVRWSLNSEMGFSKNNFSQFQVGYSFYILGRGKQK